MRRTILTLYFFLVSTIASFGQCWESVSTGYANISAIAENGTLWSWGKNSNGELGDGTNVLKNVPVQIGTDNNWKEVSAGMGNIYAHTLAVKTDGTLWAWGSNNRGQLGDGTTISKNYPVQIGTDTDWATVAAGLNHSIAIKSNGTLWGWGCSERFALIDYPSGPNVLVPEQRSPDTNWLRASAHDRVTLAIKTNGTIWGWGYNKSDMLNAPPGATIGGNVQYPAQRQGHSTNIRHTTAGNAISYDIKNDNVLTQTGFPVGGLSNPLLVLDADLGNETFAYIRINKTLWFSGIILGGSTQVPVSGTQLGTANNWKSVSVGNQCAAVINDDGDLYVWGWNTQGQLGNGINGPGTGSTTPILVNCPSVLNTPDHNLKMTVQIYPNPVQNKFTIESHLTIDRLIIIDIMGKELFNQTFSNLPINIDVSQFQDGLYIVQAFSGNSFSQIKFIKN